MRGAHEKNLTNEGKRVSSSGGKLTKATRQPDRAKNDGQHVFALRAGKNASKRKKKKPGGLAGKTKKATKEKTMNKRKQVLRTRSQNPVGR